MTATRHLLIAGLALAIAVGGCDSGPNEAQLLQSAREYLQKDDSRAATIQLKTLLQKRPNSGEGRLLLARALRAGGDTTGALVEIRKAQELGVPDEQVLPEMARILLQAGEATKVIGQFAGTELKDAQANADLLSTLASAYGTQNNLQLAMDTAARALQAVPGHAPAIVTQARVKAAQGDVYAALLMLDDVLAKTPQQAAAVMFKGELLWHVKQDRDAALAVFRGALAAQPKATAAHSAVVTLLLEQNKLDDAAAALAEMAKAAPNHPDTLLLQARLAVLKKDYAAGREVAGRLLKTAPENPLVLEVAGLAEMGLNSPQTAEGYLARAVRGAPERLAARQGLARLYLQRNDAEQALSTLKPAIEGPKADAFSLAMAGEAYLQLGDAARADDAFKRSANAAPGDTQARSVAALARLAHGDSSGAAAALESLTADDKTPRADLALVAARIRQNDLPGALKAVDGLRAKMPGKPLPDVLQGRLLQLRGDVAGATAAFEAALKKDAKYLPAVVSLAALDFAAGRRGAAQQRLKTYADAEPHSAQARMALADMALRSDAPRADVTRYIADAVRAAPNEVRPRLLQIEWLQRQGDLKGGLAAAQEAAAALPTNAEVLQALGTAQMLAGDAQQAVSTLRKLAAQQPENPAVQLRLADAYLSAKDRDSARAALKRALELQPGLIAAQRGLAGLAMQDQHPDDALAIAAEMQKRAPQSGAGWQLEGDLRSTQKNWPAAISAYRAALQRDKLPEVAVALHGALLASGQTAAAQRWTADWLKDHPRDALYLYHLGDLGMAAKDYAEAERRYRAVMELQPNNALAINNVAWLMAMQKKTGAVALAERAVRALPGSPAFLDTLAFALAAEGQLPRALETQKQAVGLAPANPMLKLGLARLLVQSGDKPQARTELLALQKLGDGFPAQGEVTELLKSAP